MPSPLHLALTAKRSADVAFKLPTLFKRTSKPPAEFWAKSVRIFARNNCLLITAASVTGAQARASLRKGRRNQTWAASFGTGRRFNASISARTDSGDVCNSNALTCGVPSSVSCATPITLPLLSSNNFAPYAGSATAKGLLDKLDNCRSQNSAKRGSNRPRLGASTLWTCKVTRSAAAKRLGNAGAFNHAGSAVISKLRSFGNSARSAISCVW